MAAHRERPRGSRQPGPDAAARPTRSRARGDRRGPAARSRPARTHLQSWSRHSPDHTRRARAGTGPLRAPADPAMKSGVLLMAHGTPSSLDEMPEYLTLVRGGRPPSAELVAEMRHNYEAIGGRSPLTDLTLAQGDALAAAMPGVPIAVGMRNWKPFIKEAVATLVKSGVTHIVGIPLAPQFSSLSVGKYFDVATMALPAGVELARVESFHSHPLLLDAFAERVRQANPDPTDAVVFTAHSLPSRVIASGDVYATEVAATAEGVASRSGIGRYRLGYQSAGRTPEPWIGPDVSEVIRAEAQ